MSITLIKKDTPWTNTGIEVDLCSFLTRHVLFEKSSPEKTKLIEMRNFFISKIDGCKLYLNSDYPDFVFYIKNIAGNKEILMQKHEKNKTFYIRYSNFWSVFESSYMLKYSEIQELTTHYLLNTLNSKGYKTRILGSVAYTQLLNTLNSKGYKTNNATSASPIVF